MANNKIGYFFSLLLMVSANISASTSMIDQDLTSDFYCTDRNGFSFTAVDGEARELILPWRKYKGGFDIKESYGGQRFFSNYSLGFAGQFNVHHRDSVHRLYTYDKETKVFMVALSTSYDILDTPMTYFQAKKLMKFEYLKHLKHLNLYGEKFGTSVRVVEDVNCYETN